MKKYILMGLTLGLFLTGCEPSKPSTRVVANPDSIARMEVISLQAISTTNGYTRDMMVVKDIKTKREYLLVQGFGAVEMVQSGKTTVEE